MAQRNGTDADSTDRSRSPTAREEVCALHVTLPSGRTATLSLALSCRLHHLRARAKEALQVDFLRLVFLGSGRFVTARYAATGLCLDQLDQQCCLGDVGLRRIGGEGEQALPGSPHIPGVMARTGDTLSAVVLPAPLLAAASGSFVLSFGMDQVQCGG
eukprot:Skav220969  [mRNA]  locus=scaffold1928:501231:503739:- [translate_table: standard]